MGVSQIAFLIFFSLQPVAVSLPTDSNSSLFLMPDSQFVSVAQRFSGYGVPMTYNSNGALYLELYNWLGVPHRRRSRNGIDCSGLVRTIMEQVFALTLKGSSRDMARMVSPLDRSELMEGDLVFFNTLRGPAIDHVGIYLGNERFIHASSSSGVIVSYLNEPYYRRTFVSAGRVLQPLSEKTDLGAEN